jgi:lysophospholipase L1-like esterase
MKRSRLATGIIVVITMIGVLIACEPPPPPPPLPLDYQGGYKVAFVGDSITRLAAPHLLARLTPHMQVNLQYMDGQTTAQMLPALEAQLHNENGTPTAVIENLGTNDVMQEAGLAGVWRPSFDQMIEMLTPVPCVGLTTISTMMEEAYHRAPLAREINDAIADAVATHPNMHVVDWNAEATGPNWKDYISDGIHPNALGADKIAELDQDLITELCP